MPETTIRVPLDDEVLARLRDFAVAERRATSDQASVLLTAAIAKAATSGSSSAINTLIRAKARAHQP